MQNRITFIQIALFSVVFFVLPSWSAAQQVENIEPLITGDSIKISYTLHGTHPQESFYVDVFIITDEAETRLTRLNGDVGYNVAPGDKTIMWDFKNELVHFSGEVQFRIDPTPVFSFANGKNVQRRGKTVSIKWKQDETFPVSSLALVNAAGQETVLTDQALDGGHNWSAPVNQKTGKYQIMAKTGNTTLYSPVFKIQRKIPTIVKALPAILAGAFTIYKVWFAPLPKPKETEDLFGN